LNSLREVFSLPPIHLMPFPLDAGMYIRQTIPDRFHQSKNLNQLFLPYAPYFPYELMLFLNEAMF